jgi:hypothetical protein
MELFSRHNWRVSDSARQCLICGRLEEEAIEMDEFHESLQWVAVDEGDIRKHWAQEALRTRLLGRS